MRSQLRQIDREFGHALARRLDLFLGELLHRRVGRHVLRRHQVAFGLLELPVARNERTEIRVLLGQRAVALDVARRILRRERHVQLVHAAGERIDF